MQLEQPAPIRKPLPLTPLVDMVFLLLMFFMLTSNFTKFGNVNLGLAALTAQKSTTTPQMPSLIIDLDRNLRIRINGLQVDLDSVSEVLDGFAGKGFLTAVLRPGASASVQDLVTLLEKARMSKLQNIRVAR
jgi:biopolymer transport protein ExbD